MKIQDLKVGDKVKLDNCGDIIKGTINAIYDKEFSIMLDSNGGCYRFFKYQVLSKLEPKYEEILIKKPKSFKFEFTPTQIEHSCSIHGYRGRMIGQANFSSGYWLHGICLPITDDNRDVHIGSSYVVEIKEKE